MSFSCELFHLITLSFVFYCGVDRCSNIFHIMDTSTFDDIKELLEELELENVHSLPGFLYQTIYSYKALVEKEEDEVAAILDLSESHSPDLRACAIWRYEEILSKKSNPDVDLAPRKDNLAFDCNTIPKEKRVERMLQQIEEMPKEWTLVQLSPQYRPESYLNEDCDKYPTDSIHISVFNCGQKVILPYMVTAEAPKNTVNGSPVEIVQEMHSIIKKNKEILTAGTSQKVFRSFQQKNDYLNRRQDIEDRLKLLIKDIENLWLKEWRCLLNGKFCDETLEQQIKDEIQQYVKMENQPLSDKCEAILLCLVKSILLMKHVESKRIIQYCFPNMDKTRLIKMVTFIRELAEKIFMNSQNSTKHPVILIVHDTLDALPWEMLDILVDESVTRVPSLHFLYCLFKEHENTICNGYKILTNYNQGAYIVNPDGDLKNMEARIMTFFNYWTPQWTGTSGYLPEREEFFELITSSEIFSYNGHGSGNHLMSMEKIESVRVKAVVLLFGCGSTRVTRYDPQIGMYGNYYMYLIARCPCVVGMLWEVADFDTDILTTDFLSYWIPSKAPLHWRYIDKNKWRKANDKVDIFKTTNTKPINNNNEDGSKQWEPDLLKALNMAKKNLTYRLTKCACVVRGLPVRIENSSI